MTIRTAAVALTLAATAAAQAQLTTLLEEDFTTNPVGSRATVAGAAGGDPARFTYNAGALTAAYDSVQPTTKLVWQLPAGTTLTPNDRFAFDATFTIAAEGFSADPDGFAQIAFGLQNATTTGNQRTGYGTFDPITFTFTPLVTADAFDLATADYFPNISPFFPGPSLQPFAANSDDGNPDTDMFVGAHYPTTANSAINEVTDLPRDLTLTASFDYDPATRRVALRILDADGNALPINTIGDTGPGGLDGDTTTIDFLLAPSATFELDSFALLLWQDLYAVNHWSGSAVASVTANVSFDRFRVQVPEPATALLLAAAALLAPRRRRPLH